MAILGKDYGEGADLVHEFRSSGAIYVPGATVWNVNPERRLTYSKDGVSFELAAGAIVVASGAIERPMPMPGWTLPGVMTAGACQILLKSSGLISDDVVFVGCGPLLWLIAAQMVAAGKPPKAIVETVPPSRYIKALRKLSFNRTAFRYFKKGAAMMFAVKQAGVPVYRDARDIAVVGEGRAEALTFRAGGCSHRIDTSLVALHQGVVPNQQITRLLRCVHEWNADQRCFVPTLDAFGESSVPNIYVAGDGGGIGGAKASILQGRLAGRRIVQKAKATEAEEIVRLQRRLRNEMAIRPFLESLYAPSHETSVPADDVVICRCEEITAGQIRSAVDLGASGPNQVKSYLRNGMGPCQGRICGLAVTEIIAEKSNVSPAALEYYRIRPPLKPLALSELATLGSTEPARNNQARI